MKTKRKAANQIVRRPSSRKIVHKPVLTLAEGVEKVLIGGDLSPLTPEQRVDYYKKVCLSLGINPLTNPFAYILYKERDEDEGKLALYALRACTDQLRKIHGVTVVSCKRWQ